MCASQVAARHLNMSLLTHCIHCPVCGHAFLIGRAKCVPWLDTSVCLKDLEGSFRYLLGRESVFAPGGRDCLAHTMQKVINIVGLTALRLAFFMGYE